MQKIGVLDSEIAKAVENSTVVELSPDKLKVRKNYRKFNDDISFMGFDKHGIRNLTPG